jgi:hypothetical protein
VSGVGGGRFTGTVWAIHCLSLSHSLKVSLSHSSMVWVMPLVVRSLSLCLARLVSLSHSLSLAHSLPLTLTDGLGHVTHRSLTVSLSHSLSLPLTLTLALSQSPSHSLSLACRKLPQRPRISAANFPQGRAPDAQIRSERKKKKKKEACKNLSESGGVLLESLLIRVSA